MKPTFQNRPNEPVTDSNGKTIWHSRSCAVVADVCLYNRPEDRWYILLEKRGTGVPDEQGKWCLPCGYLDWDETLIQAMLREVWEECGLYLPSLSSREQFIDSQFSGFYPKEGYHETPWKIVDRPRGVKQNISFHFAAIFSWNSRPFPNLTVDNADVNEVADVEWVPIKDAMEQALAFNHQDMIIELWQEHPEQFRALMHEK